MFLIGMRINRPWKIHKWLPVVLAMPRLIKELLSKPDSGLLGYEMWFGRTTIMLQYWRSTEQLLAYAKNRDAAHLPAWKAYNQAVGTHGDVGIWHETYVASPGSFENIYVNMPTFGLGKAGMLLPASGNRESAKDRFRAGTTSPKPSAVARDAPKTAHPQFHAKELCMTQYTAQVLWLRGEQDFLNNRYSRSHVLRFDGGVEVAGSSSPHIVPLPMSEVAAVDPEEAFVSSLSSCHMLWFLSIAVQRKFCVDRYFDAAIGEMGKSSEGKISILVITLKPEVRFSGNQIPTREQIDDLHHEAHKACYIANSVKTEIRCEPVYVALS